MFFFNTIAAISFVAASVLGAPLESRKVDHFTPTAIWQYNVKTGAISATEEGKVFKDESNQGNDITALLTFKYPEAAKNKKCQFAFYLDKFSGLSGSKKLDLYTSNSPAPGERPSWGPGNQRNIHLGRLSSNIESFATWDATYNAYLTKKTNCKAPGTEEGFELVGVHDRDYFSWNPKTAGPRIIISSS